LWNWVVILSEAKDDKIGAQDDILNGVGIRVGFHPIRVGRPVRYDSATSGHGLALCCPHSNPMKLEQLSFLALISCAGLATHTNAQVTVDLGSAESYGVLAGTSATDTGSSIVTGDLGVSPGATATGFGGLVTGAINLDNAAAIQAKSDLALAYTQAAEETPTSSAGTLTYNDQTLAPGVYKASSTMDVSGTVTLNGGANSVFVFQAGTTLTAELGTDIVLTGGVKAQNVFWQVGTSATLLGDASTFEGTILADTSITVDSGSTVIGDLLAKGGAVTLDGSAVTAIPEPASTSLWLAALAGLALIAAKFRRELVA